MKNTTVTCLSEDIPSYFELGWSLALQLHDLLNENYEKNFCSSPTYSFWLYKLSLEDLISVMIFTYILAFVRCIAGPKVKRFLKDKLNTTDNSTDRAVLNICQLIGRLITIPWAAYEVFIKPDCSVFSNPSLSWRNLDPFSVSGQVNIALPVTSMTSLSTSLLYRFAISVYIFHLFSVLFLEEKRRDFWMLLVHHLTTLTLITMSYTIGFTEMGILILLLHDICDPFLEFGKVCYYLTQRRDGMTNEFFHVFIDPCFYIFIPTWIVARLFYYPLRGIHSLTLVTRKTCHFPSIAFSAILLSILLLLNLIWFYMILRALANRLKNGKMTDELMHNPKTQNFGQVNGVNRLKDGRNIK